VSRLQPFAWLAPLALTGAVGSVAVAHTLRSELNPEPPASVLGGQVVKGDAGDEAARSFVVSGDVNGLAPGVTRPLQLRLGNPNGADIAVQSLQVTVGDSGAGCGGDALHVGPFSGPVLVPGHGEAQISLPVTMAGSASSTCQGATFPLTYGGSAVKT